MPPESATCTEFWGDAADIRPRLRAPGPIAVLEYWNKLRGGRRFPSRADFDPMSVRQHLPNIFMFDVLPGDEFRYRVAGTNVAEFLNAGNPVGKTPEEIFGGRAQPVVAPLRFICSTGQAYMRTASASWAFHDRNYVYYEVVSLPLGDGDEAVDKILGCAEFVREEDAARR
ncbi:PAS domain-containing protein [Parvibaculum sp.]|uniref:PAS domain-containing protein n=1 Tax=Parvibaculum sp. TaxID=2024848 RepID=UPI003919DE7D